MVKGLSSYQTGQLDVVDVRYGTLRFEYEIDQLI